MKLKTLVAALALGAAATGANAALDAGTGGNGELFFSIWDASQSYSFDLNKNITTFEADVAAAGNIDQTYALTNFATFMSGVSNAAALNFGLTATDTSGARRLLVTFTAPAPGVTKLNDSIRTAAANTTAIAGSISTAMGVNNFAIVGSPAAAAYAGKVAFGNGNLGNMSNTLNFSMIGKLAANDDYAGGLGFMRIDALATGTASSVYTPYMDGGTAVRVWVAGNDLHIAAAPVPEPETYGMLLAGLGMIGFMARRRLGNRA
jgi:hypothetical protein